MASRSKSQAEWRAGDVDPGRRRAVGALSAGLAGVLASPQGFAQAVGACVLTPDSGEGPFYFDPKLLRVDIADGKPGAPLEIAIQIVRGGDCATLAGARVDVWHADATGLYSGYEAQPGNGGVSASAAVGQTFLRGTQFTDPDGNARFRTVYPSWYRGRTPHVHFKVFTGRNERVASQIFFPEAVNDRVFAQWEPYRRYVGTRDTRNAGDTFLRGRTDGVFCEVDESADGFSGSVVVAVRDA